MSAFLKKIRAKNNKLIEELRKDPCFFCGQNGPSEVHHIKSKKSGGPDEKWNLIPVDRICHVEVHKRGLAYMMQKYLTAGANLKRMGWELDQYGRMRNYKNGGEIEC